MIPFLAIIYTNHWPYFSDEPLFTKVTKTEKVRRNNVEKEEEISETQKKKAKRAKKKSFKQAKNLRIRKKELEQDRRSRIKANPKLYEAYLEKARERRNKAVAEGKVKSVSDMSERELRIQRQKVRARVRKHRLKMKAKIQADPSQATSALAVNEATPQNEIQGNDPKSSGDSR